MGEKKNNSQLHEEKKYEFMREQVRPQKVKEIKSVSKKIVWLILSAIVFGIVSSSVFIFVNEVWGKDAKQTVSVKTLKTAEPVATPTAKPVSIKKKTEKEEMDYFLSMSQKLAYKGECMENALVGIERKDADLTQYDSGLVIRETKKLYYILTDCKNLNDKNTLTVLMSDYTKVSGTVIDSDTELNIAVVSIRKKDLSEALQQKIKVAKLGNKSFLRKGSYVIAVGAPNGIFKSVMVGKIVKDEINISVLDNEIRMYISDMIYSKEGNGVILDTDGNVIGMISTSFSSSTGTSALSFIDMLSIEKSINLIRKGQNSPYLGIYALTLPEKLVAAKKIKNGAYVREVISKSPSYKAGMRVGDVITEVDGYSIQSVGDVHKVISEKKKGDKVVVTVARKSGKEDIQKKLTIKLG